MAARKRSAIDSMYILDHLSDSESHFSFDSDSDINFSDCSSSSDESDHDSINLQSVRQWCKIDMKNIPPPPVPFRGNPGITLADILVTEKMDTYGTVNKTQKRPPCQFFKRESLQGGNYCLSKSYTRAFGDRPRNFEPWSSDVDDTRAGTPSPNDHTTPMGGRFSSRQI
ncbi:hypothetical protein TNCV_3779932 [Trichonephila clavipes]|nr:hypothetical protein TNCV_3779932 [Trichonephila clavipes]